MGNDTLSARSRSAAERSRMYALLATALAYPSQEGVDGMVEAASEGALGFPESIRPRIVGLTDVIGDDIDALRRAHRMLFPPIESTLTPGHETAYRGDELFNHTAVMADVAGFYRAFGLEVGGSQRERPDHITVELEYLAFVTFKEAVCAEQQQTDQADVCREAEHAFLCDHLGDWGPELGRRLEQHSDHPFFTYAGTLLASWVDGRVEELGIDPSGSAGVVTPAGPGVDAAGVVAEPSDWVPLEFVGRRS